MRRLIYALQFVRPAGTTPGGEPIVAASASITTAITPAGVNGEIETLDQYQTALVQVTVVHNPDGTFTESGTITFGDPAEAIPRKETGFTSAPSASVTSMFIRVRKRPTRRAR